jgi:hypothetical protein
METDRSDVLEEVDVSVTVYCGLFRVGLVPILVALEFCELVVASRGNPA